MDDKLRRIIQKLYDSVLDEDFSNIAYDIIEQLEENINAFDAIEPILIFMEQNPDVQFGTPGPLVHFIEKFYKKGYEDKLIDSLRRQPTKHTVWMLNRIINGSTEEKKKSYIDVLESISNSQSISQDVRSLAQHYKSLHK